MQQRPHLAKQTIDEHQLNKLNKTTQSKTDKLSHSGKLAYINDDYCEITRNYTSFYGMNILGVVLFLPVAILCFGAVLFFFYDAIFNYARYVETWQSRADDQLLMHFAVVIIFFMTFVFAAVVNYFIFAPRHYPVRFNRKTGKVYVYDHVMYSITYKLTYTFWWYYPFYKRTRPECKEYDWSQIQAISIYSRNKHSSYSTIRCIVYDSSISTTMIDAFNLISTDAGTDALLMPNYKLWLWICNYMSFNDRLLDTSVNTQVGIYGREVKWPDDIDKKSKAFSLDEYRRICSE
ncbi:DUF6708 domain-containing protein [Klebsiella pasteurii]|uniref:DUF6708 domain-containing protein n=1 Tax=Klebsiella pasteurii TaxID=2587529 RepID=UPI00115714DE|nr:DUF6708 domain-containing protein [Klebsiella pasteurii]VUT16619.1 hypothetical protein SB6416_04051 [Klebsiella pasteurii]